MFKVHFITNNYRPDLSITLRCNKIGNWQEDIAGNYTNDRWVFLLDEDPYDPYFEFKFVLEHQVWMAGGNLQIHATNGENYYYDENQVYFAPVTEAIVENGAIAQQFFKPNLDENFEHDLIVIGSGIGGGVVAEQAADLGLDVLVLELGSYLFPSHIGNLPRQHHIENRVDKHIWGLWDEFKTDNYNDVGGSKYDGAQGFCLGGRSVFWGGFIPRMSWWELESWPQAVKWYLEGEGYDRAEQLMKKSTATSKYHKSALRFFKQKFRKFSCDSAPMAVETSNIERNNVASGVFSTADLLMESRMTAGESGAANLTVNLNHAVTKLNWHDNQIDSVEAYDLIAHKARTYKAKNIVLAAGTIESAKIAQLSYLKNDNELVGKGITDHPIYFCHFAIPDTSPVFNAEGASKILLKHKDSNQNDKRFNILIELGADFNQGRNVDDDILDDMRDVKHNTMLCEIVFLFNTPLLDQNYVEQNGPSYVKPGVYMEEAQITGAEWEEINGIKTEILNAIGGQALPNNNLDLKLAGLGGVAHEAGTLRMGENGAGVVNENLKYHGYDNLYVCDLSVFPTSPAANPTLTLGALAQRLADHLKDNS